MLEIRDLHYAWPGAGGECLAIERLDIAAGRAVFLHGPSGCGKSTLLGLMAGVLVAPRGQVSRAEHVGVIFQQFNLLPYVSVLDNVLLPCRFSAARARRCAGGPVVAAQALLQRVALPPSLWPRRADALSVGQQQRVAAARALIGRPGLVIADEPTSALDASLRDDGSTLVFVSHDDRLAARFDERLSLPALNRAAALS